MTTKKKKVDNTDSMIAEFSANFAKAAAEDHAKHQAMPKVHDVDAGEFMHEVNPADADKHLED